MSSTYEKLLSRNVVELTSPTSKVTVVGAGKLFYCLHYYENIVYHIR